MIVKSAFLRNIRCYSSETLTFHPRFNLIFGENGQGKTNLLEAVYMLCRFKPLRGVSSSEVVRFGERSALLRGRLEKSSTGMTTDISVVFTQKAGKRVEVDGKKPSSLAEKAIDFGVVHFTPSEVDLAKGAPSLLRRYFDSIICGLVPSHFQDLKDFQRTIRQRNFFLSSGRATASGIEPWNERVAEIGGRIVQKRVRLVKRINRGINSIYGQICGGQNAAVVSASYEPSFEVSGKGDDMPQLQASIRKSLESAFSRDVKIKHTSAGPHRDIISLRIDGRECSLFASQGEARSVVLALKMAEIRLYEAVVKESPIFLLDDISSELDAGRRKFLFDILSEYSGQIFVTSTSASDIPYKGERRIFRVEAGRVADTKQTG